jgi:hypothetical protein
VYIGGRYASTGSAGRRFIRIKVRISPVNKITVPIINILIMFLIIFFKGK